ncbi:MAG: iron-sulfur cluster assembly scaffold protein [Candidatus Nezhaarchaeales archaeon]|nr:MAG: iron-sulfur cluster assembly scaffold protein [Candidatus Nezhaarchaeota archaeon WYZ-LMO8]TDA35322.1 MAG: iron-sulfur cluster assembly scaffold protein [Candidatus Nezhaarchaeota archaeon WYZ-LMO7]
MSSRVPLTYGKKVIELFRSPKNLGKIDNADAEALAGSLACGDMIAIYLKIDETNGKIVDAKFESYGCAANIAAASILTEMIKGKSLQDAWKVSWKEVSDELGGLPSVKYHCGVLAVGALRRAIRDYYADKPKPDWLPQELTREEKQALEEEKLMEILSRRAQKSSAN